MLGGNASSEIRMWICGAHGEDNRETGIIEELMLDIMYQIPKDDNIGRVTITKEYVENTGGPVIEMRGVYTLENKTDSNLIE